MPCPRSFGHQRITIECMALGIFHKRCWGVFEECLEGSLAIGWVEIVWRDTSRSNHPSHTYHISEVSDGVGRLGTSQMLSLSCTIYIHATSTFLDPYNPCPLLTSHLPSSSPSSAFLGFWVIRDSAHSLLHVPPCIYIIEHSHCTPFDRLFS